MKPLSIFSRLLFSNAVILILILGMGVWVSRDLIKVQDIHQDLLARHQKSILANERLMDAFDLLVQFDQKFFVARDPDYLNGFNQQKNAVENEFAALYRHLETLEQKMAFDRGMNAFQAYLAWVLANARSGMVPYETEFETLSKQRGPMVRKVTANLNRVLVTTRTLVTQRTQKSGDIIRKTFLITVLTTLGILIAGFVITLKNARSIRNSVKALQETTKEISQGRFEEISHISGPGEIQNLARHFNTMCRRLRELDELKADFISHVSHELRTPLTSIKEAASMLAKGYYDSQPENRAQFHGIIHDECRRLLASVMRILDFSKMEAGKMEYQTAPTPLPDLIRKSILKLAPMAQAKGVFLEFIPPPPDLPPVLADRDRIIEVLDNLIGNAIKFTPKTGWVGVNCLKAEKEGVLVRVTDNGPGIALEHLEKIFYKFKQIDNALTTRMGTGLGLSISKYIIRAHGGNIWAKNMETGGTRISFTLPSSSS